MASTLAASNVRHAPLLSPPGYLSGRASWTTGNDPRLACYAKSNQHVFPMGERSIQPMKIAMSTCGMAAAVALLAPCDPALAFRVAAQMEDVQYEEVTCASRPKPGFTCVKFSGKVNNTDKEPINTADIYGRIYDKAGNDVTDNAENDRIGFVDLVSPGTSEVSFEIPVLRSQLEAGKLVWKGLKVSGYTGKVLPGQSGLLGLPTDLDCSAIGPDSDILDIEACEQQDAESAIR